MCFNEHDDETCYDDGIVDNNRDAVRHAFTVMLRLATQQGVLRRQLMMHASMAGARPLFCEGLFEGVFLG